MNIEVDPTSPLPPYEQLRRQLVALIASSTLAPGTRLPSIRQLAGDLELANGTVARAYRELEAEGLVTSRVRHGTVVAARPRMPVAERRARLAAAARDYALAVGQLGVDPQEAVEEVRRRLAPRAAGPTDTLPSRLG